MPVYTLYGLRVSASAALPGLRPDTAGAGADGDPVVSLVIGRLPAGLEWQNGRTAPPWHLSPHLDSQGQPMLSIRALPAAHHLRYADGTEFVVERGGGAVWCRWPAALSLENTCTYLLGPVMGFLLRQQGFTCLHASAVEVDGGAVLLVGQSGAGKSTTAAALARRGLRVLADDVAVLQRAGGAWEVRAAHAQLRLWPDSAGMLYGPAHGLPPLTEGWDKRFVDLAAAGRYQASALPIRGVYLLHARCAEASRPRVDRPAAADLLVSLLSNVYMADLPDRAARARDLGALASLVRSVPARALLPHADPARLDALCEALLADVQSSR
ncbi:MAG TPA: hypothetical protein VFH27_10080 [Longimicrobiaceae bacterium]|nr:hypothetical protein [Longimicrobiaceae bacterium]